MQSNKRPISNDDIMISSKRRKQAVTKNPVARFHELFKGVKVELDSNGTSKETSFLAKALVKDLPFEGVGQSKQKAKTDLAINVFNHFGLLDDCEMKTDYFQRSADNYADFDMPNRKEPLYTSPNSRNMTQSYPETVVKMEVENGSPHRTTQQGFSQLFSNLPDINVEKACVYPVMMVSEIFPNLKFDWVDGSGRGDRQFKVETEVHGRRFFGEGRSKKMAKLNLCKTVLLCMYDISDFKEIKTPVKSNVVKLDKKFPLTQLKNYVGEDLIFDVVQQEPIPGINEKVFHATVVVENVAYEAIGNTKNFAKLQAAKKALDVIKPKKDPSVHKDDDGKPIIDTSRYPTMVFFEIFRDVKFIRNEIKGSSAGTEYTIKAEVENQTFSAKASSKKKAKLRLVLQVFETLRNIDRSLWTSIDLKDVTEDKPTNNNSVAGHPIVLLLKLNPKSRFTINEDYNCDPTLKYKAIALVGDHEFNGEGPNKKIAKSAAARTALSNLYGIDPDNYVESTQTDFFVNTDSKQEIPVEVSNLISDAVKKKFTAIIQGERQCKVIAAFIVCKFDGIDQSPAEVNVVSIGTGTKCVSGNKMDQKGQTLNDCHGEIIACRGFRQYLFDELLEAFKNNSETIFFQQSNGRLSLKKDLKVYLYVNTAPCGDGRVFTMQKKQQSAKNKTAGLLRTKIENGQGTIPVPNNNVQTSDGILEGERLRTMSCSDKILKWNAVGVQGALLSCFVDPIYIDGIVIDLHYNYEALYRALYKRAGKIKNTPEHYRLNHVMLGKPDNLDNGRNTSKSSSNSFNWYNGQQTVEAVNAVTGQTVMLQPSRLCKLQFFNKFHQALSASKLKIGSPTTYHDAKQLAIDYQKAKDCFIKALDENTCGKWLGKPYEHDMFGY